MQPVPWASTARSPKVRRPLTSWRSAPLTDTRYVTEWLRGQAAGGDVMYDPAIDTYWLTEEQAFALTDPDGPLLRRCIAIVPECADAATALALG